MIFEVYLVVLIQLSVKVGKRINTKWRAW